MAEIINLPENIIGKEDHERLESFGAHEISHGRATRFHWDKNESHDPVFELYRGGPKEELAVRIHRDMAQDLFVAEDKNGETIVTGSLDHVMAVLDKRFTREHDTDNPA